MFDESSTTGVTYTNYNAAVAWMLKKVGRKESKRIQNFFKFLVVARAGFEVQQGLATSETGALLGVKFKAAIKYKAHNDAFHRQAALLFSEDLREYKQWLPTWLTPAFVKQKNMKGEPHDPASKDLWVCFEKILRFVRSDYLSLYNKLVPPNSKLPSGVAWIEALDKFRKALWLKEKPQKNNDDDDGADVADDVDPDDADAADADANADDTTNDTTNDTTIQNATNDGGIECPEGYLPVFLLTFIALGPPSPEPNPAWNVTGLSMLKSHKSVELPSTTTLPQRSSSVPDTPNNLTESRFNTPLPPDQPLSRKKLQAIGAEIAGIQSSAKRQRQSTPEVDVAALERNNTIMSQKNTIIAERNTELLRQGAINASKHALEKKKEAIRMAEDLQMDPAQIRILKMEYFALCQAD
jgi:hypothetical protein